MRVIAGHAKGHPLSAPKGTNTRPTTDRVREAIFSVLQPYVADALVLDVFAGSGAMAIEALSRGAAGAVLMEKHRSAQQVIEANLAACQMTEAACLKKGDCLKLLTKEQQPYHIIFLDPPYDQGYVEPVLNSITDYHLLAENGIIVLETAKNAEKYNLPDGLQLWKTSHYGDTSIFYLRKNN